MRQPCWVCVLTTVTLGVALPAAAAPERPSLTKPIAVASEPAAALVTLVAPLPGGFMVPRVVALRATTAAEAEANAVWNIRAALNVAALQCQFSQFLATVRNYNDFLKHHSDELVRAQKTLIAHFRRYDGARATNSFDQYTTRTYNSYSTLDAQYKFCEAGGMVGREVLAVGKGRLGDEALRRNPEIRAALSQQPLSPALAVTYLNPIELIPISAPGD